MNWAGNNNGNDLLHLNLDILYQWREQLNILSSCSLWQLKSMIKITDGQWSGFRVQNPSTNHSAPHHNLQQHQQQKRLLSIVLTQRNYQNSVPSFQNFSGPNPKHWKHPHIHCMPQLLLALSQLPQTFKPSSWVLIVAHQNNTCIIPCQLLSYSYKSPHCAEKLKPLTPPSFWILIQSTYYPKNNHDVVTSHRILIWLSFFRLKKACSVFIQFSEWQATTTLSWCKSNAWNDKNET